MKNTFIHRLACHIKDKYDLKNEELTVVFPNKRAAFYLRSKLAELLDEDIWLPQMLSIEEAVTQWSGVRLVDTIDMLFELIAIDGERSGKGNNVSLFGSMASQMAKDFDEIDQYGVDAQHLFSYIYEEKKIGLWQLDQQITPKEEQYLAFFRELKTYYDRLRQRLESQGKGYYGMITRQLANLDEDILLERTHNRMVLFAGFNALTPTEQRIIDKLYKNHKAEVIWDFDRYYVDDPQNEAGWFARQYLAKDLPWKPTEFSDSLLHDPKEIHFVGVSGNTIQSKALQSLLQVEVKEDTTVILADENLMIPMLNAIPEIPNYPSIKVSMGYPLRQTSVSRLVAEVFTLHRKGRQVRNEGWYLWPVLRILDLELIKVVFNKQEINEIAQYKSFILKKSAFIFKESDFQAICQNEDLKTMMRLLLGSQAEGSPTERMLLTITELLAFFAHKIQSAEHIPDKLFLLNQVSETGKTINRLKDILARYPRQIQGVEDLEILYKLVSGNTDIKLNSSSTNGLQLMGLLEARNLDFDTFYMVGVNEGIIPAAKSFGSFIPYHIRKECHLPDFQEKQAVYAYHFYRLLQGVQRAYFLYNMSDAESGGEPSRFLLQLKYELAQRNPNLKLVEEVFDNRTETHAITERLTASKTPEVMEKLLQKVTTPDFKHALAPTSIAAFIQCPLRFFLKYIMKIEDNKAEEETQNNVIGTIVHDTLEKLYINYRNTLINKELFTNIIKPLQSQTLQEVIAESFAQGLPNVGYNYLNKLTIDKLFENYFRYEEKEVAHHELQILHVEHTLHTTLNVNGISCTIAGKADRIDLQDGIVRIIDYKTGILKDNEVKVPKDIDDVRAIPEKAMQLLIYKYLYLKEHPEVQADKVTASLFGLKQQKIRFDLKVDNPELNADFVDTMESLLSQLLSNMMNIAIPFGQPTDTRVKPCHFCDFKGICANTATGVALANDR